MIIKEAIFLNIKEIGDEKIVVSLSKDDLKNLDITYDEMDYSNIETRRVIWTILDEAQINLGKSIDMGGKMLIEVCPDENGGCIMYFTVMHQFDGKQGKKLIMKKDAEPLLLELFDENSFIDVFYILKNEKESVVSFDGCRYKNKYYYIIQPKVASSVYLTYMLSEYGDIEIALKEDTALLFEFGENYFSESTA